MPGEFVTKVQEIITIVVILRKHNTTVGPVLTPCCITSQAVKLLHFFKVCRNGIFSFLTTLYISYSHLGNELVKTGLCNTQASGYTSSLRQKKLSPGTSYQNFIHGHQ